MAFRTKMRMWTAMKAINDPAKMPCGTVLWSLEGEGDLAFARHAQGLAVSDQMEPLAVPSD
jgi:hypothetical protein